MFKTLICGLGVEGAHKTQQYILVRTFKSFTRDLLCAGSLSKNALFLATGTKKWGL